MATKVQTHDTKKATSKRQAAPGPSPIQSAGPHASIQHALADPSTLSPADVLQLQRTLGNRAVDQLWAAAPRPASNLIIQARLTVGPAGDKYEQEAERVAQQVTHPSAGSGQALTAPASEAKRSSQPPAARRLEQEEETLADQLVQRETIREKPQQLKANFQSIGLKGGDTDTNLDLAIQRARGGGQPLPGHVRARLEDGFGADFSNVRVHLDAQSDKLNRSLQAKAFTTGQDVFFQRGAYDPGSSSGQQLIAHELTHVVQQQGDTVRRKSKVESNKATGVPLPTPHAAMEHAPARFSVAPQNTLQAKPSDFKPSESTGPLAHKLARGWVFLGTNYWKAVRDRLDEYVQLGDQAAVPTRQAALRLLAKAVQDWKTQALGGKQKNQLSNDELLKLSAAEQLDNRILSEWTEFGGGLGNLQVHGLPVATADPELTKKVKKEKENKRDVLGGLFTQAVDILALDNKVLAQTSVGKVCKFVDNGTAPNGKNAKDYHKVKPDEKAQNSGNYANFPEGYVAKDAIVEVERTQRRTDLQYSNRTNPALYPLFPHTPTVADVQQIGLGDCYFLAAVLNIVRAKPNYFKSIMKDNGNGTVTVQLHEVDNTGPAKRYPAKNITVNKSIVVKQNGQAAFAGGALWVQILEKAYVATGFYGSTEKTLPVSVSSYGMVEGGGSNIAFEHLMGTESGEGQIKAYGAGVLGGTGEWLGSGDFITFLDTKGVDIQTWAPYMLAMSAAFGDLHKREMVRREEVITFFNNKHKDKVIPQNIRDLLVNWVEAKNIYPGKRGTGKYTQAQLDSFDAIKQKIDAGRYVGVATKEKIWTPPLQGQQRQGQSGDESMGKGLAGRHAYTVLDYSPKVAPQGGDYIRSVKLRNPWGHYGRKYFKKTLKGRGEEVDASKPGVWQGRVEAVEEEGAAEFWVELSDLTKRFDKFYYTVPT